MIKKIPKTVVLSTTCFPVALLLAAFFIVSVPFAHAQTSAPDLSAPAVSLSASATSSQIQTVYKAKVLGIVSQHSENVPGIGGENTANGDLTENDQTLDVTILDGDEAGKALTVDNDYSTLAPGDVFYLIHTTDPSDPNGATDGSDYYTVSDPYRLPALGVLLGIFILCVIIFGGWQGIRGLASLAGGMALIIFVLLPGILHGYSPVLISIGVSSLIIVVGSYITHGFNRTTSAAVVGMIATVVCTGIFAYIAVGYTKLTGFSNEEAVYLNSAVSGGINLAGLLLGGILIGLLGVLYDIAISQAIVIEELRRIAPHEPRRHIYARAIRIGREHIGALVNTLAIAYVGVSLPLLLLLYSTSTNIAMTVNQEIFATEIVRILVGSIGLVFAVPIVTLVAIGMLTGKGDDDRAANASENESGDLRHIGHWH